MKTRIARYTVEATAHRHWFFEVPHHASREDVHAYIMEQEFLTDTPPSSQTHGEDELDQGEITFIGMPVEDEKAIKLDPDYTGWPFEFEIREGQCVWWNDPDEGACSGWMIITFVDPHSTTLHCHHMENSDGHTEVLRGELSLTCPPASSH